MKIAFVIDSLELGGANILTVDLVNYLFENNFDITVFSLSKFDKENKAILRSLHKDVKVYSLDLFSYSFMKRIKLLTNLLKEFDLIHSCLESSNFYTTLLKLFKIKNKKLIITYHGVDAFYINDKLLSEAIFIILKNNS